MYKLSTEIKSIANFVGYEKAIEMIAKAGFECWDFSLMDMISYNWAKDEFTAGSLPLMYENYKNYVLNLKKIGEKYGIECNQAHAPYPSYTKGIEPYIIRSIECASLAGAKVIVIHPCNSATNEENAKMFKFYLKYAHKYNIKIAVENMFNWDKNKGCALKASCSNHNEFLNLIKLVNDPYFVACVDVGHASMMNDTNAPLIIRTLGSYVNCLHIHDNDKQHDRHQLPFSMNIDFDSIIQSLIDINYQGDFTLEADQYLSKFEGTLEEGIKNLLNSVKLIKEKFLKLKELNEKIIKTHHL